ncbi:FKBP-type peptidyl-prolyl cis-trans isomerase [Ralstonia sp. UBA689]|uniref:FKBP-type peptidyl-prolyl cis-trans isomerase n=1 Tax=Ralstonia sp. UBA689 TaxID=1947373 RepID=UPI0025E03DF9|nr:FKBP-type peptidyl-prolyl cis-trans isomerase [Ralstonia sp. UBA689]
MKRLSLLLCASSLAIAATTAQAASPASSETLPSGVIVQTLAKGAGTSPKAGDTVKVHYRGTLTDGTEFDSSYKRGQPISFPLNRVIPCWTEGVQKMKVGGKAKLTCPAATAYGERGVPGTIPPNSTLNFEVELLGIGG